MRNRFLSLSGRIGVRTVNFWSQQTAEQSTSHKQISTKKKRNANLEPWCSTNHSWWLSGQKLCALNLTWGV
ncbi:unnamed protein product [Rhodiola kirilowii]